MEGNWVKFILCELWINSQIRKNNILLIGNSYCTGSHKTRAGSLAALLFCHTVILFLCHSVFLCLSVCLSVGLSFYLYDILLTFWTTFVLTTKLKNLYLFLSVFLSVCLSVSLSVFWHVVLSFWHPVNILNKICFDN